jgi:hypothetical protein
LPPLQSRNERARPETAEQVVRPGVQAVEPELGPWPRAQGIEAECDEQVDEEQRENLVEGDRKRRGSRLAEAEDFRTGEQVCVEGPPKTRWGRGGNRIDAGLENSRS